MLKIITKYYYRFEEFWLYSVGGALGFVVDFSLLFILTEYAGLHYLISTAIAVIIAILVNYSWQRFVTFKSSERNVAKQFGKFVIISVFAIGLTALLMYILVDIVGLWYLLAKIFVTIIVWFWNFFGNKYFTFKVKNSLKEN